ncbi:MAG: hypothetical protein E7540_03320 [Ruminococcaceae bacterium]|nr:hypothetical protein [Oscillospiraceae bacterium]
MNGYKVLEEGAKLIGISSLDDNLKIIGLPLLNSVVEDMGFVSLPSLSHLIGLPSDSHRRTLVFGVAMLLANALGDTEARESMSDIYSKRLGLIKGSVSSVRDVMPKGEI